MTKILDKRLTWTLCQRGKKKRRPVIVISVTERDEETIISRRDYAAVYFLDSRLVCIVFDQRLASSCKSGKDNLWAQKNATSFSVNRISISQLSRRWSRQRDILLLRRHGNNHQCIFPLCSPVSFSSTDPLSDDFLLNENLRSRYEDGSRLIRSRHVERGRWFGEKLSDTFLMRVSGKILISLSSREYVWKVRWTLERMEFFKGTRSIHYANGYVSFFVKLMDRCLVFKMKDRELFSSIHILRW